MRNCCTSNFASVVSVYIARACETHADCFVSGEHSGSTYCNVDGECAFDGCTDASDAVDGSCPTGVAGTQHQFCTDCGTAGSQSNGHLRFGNLCGQVRNAVDGGTYDVDCATEGRTISVVASGWLQLAEVEVYVSGDAWTDGSVNFAVSAATSACAVVADPDGRRCCEQARSNANAAAVAGTADACNPINLNDYSSWNQMSFDGWTHQTSGDMHLSDMSEGGVAASCQDGSNSWFGWSHNAEVGVLSHVLPATGTGTVDFGNCWHDPGDCVLYVNGREVSRAGPSTLHVTATISFQAGDMLTLQDEGDNSVCKLTRINLQCGGGH